MNPRSPWPSPLPHLMRMALLMLGWRKRLESREAIIRLQGHPRVGIDPRD